MPKAFADKHVGKSLYSWLNFNAPQIDWQSNCDVKNIKTKKEVFDFVGSEYTDG